jgi:hypothetical protein
MDKKKIRRNWNLVPLWHVWMRIEFEFYLLFAVRVFQKQIRFYSTFSNFISESQTIQTYVSTLFA